MVDSEYIIDLMGAPGALIPAEVPGSHLQTAGLDLEPPFGPCLLLNKGSDALAVSPCLDSIPEVCSSRVEELSFVGKQINPENLNLDNKNQCLETGLSKMETDRFEHELGKLSPFLYRQCESSSSIPGKQSSAQKKKVKNVSRYVISAAKNPEFAQKLHAVLLESGASPPPDLFTDINPRDLRQQKVHLVNGKNAVDVVHHQSENLSSSCTKSPLVPSIGLTSYNNFSHENYLKQPIQSFTEQKIEDEPDFIKSDITKSDISVCRENTGDSFVIVSSKVDEPISAFAAGVNAVPVNLPGVAATTSYEKQIHGSMVPPAEFCLGKPESIFINDNRLVGRDSDYNELGEVTLEESKEVADNGQTVPSNDLLDRLGDVAEWEILWEDLQIGERIGIGKMSSLLQSLSLFLDSGDIFLPNNLAKISLV